jgi:hypothetical protein
MLPRCNSKTEPPLRRTKNYRYALPLLKRFWGFLRIIDRPREDDQKSIVVTLTMNLRDIDPINLNWHLSTESLRGNTNLHIVYVIGIVDIGLVEIQIMVVIKVRQRWKFF